MKTVRTKTTYLQMMQSPESRVDPPAGVTVDEGAKLASEDYRHLYRAVGSTFHWIDRLLISNEELESTIHHAEVTICRLQVENKVAGFCELDRRTRGEVEVAYFGLVSSFIGRGLGKYFLNWTLHKAWSYQPDRVWLHTCDLDHPAALPNYLKAGFQVFDTEVIIQPIADDSPLGEQS